MLRLTDVRWTHYGTQVYADCGSHTIWNTSISNRHNPQPFSVYANQPDGQAYRASFAHLHQATHYINEENRK